MAKNSELVTKEFLFVDENVKYSFDVDNQQLTVKCDHPIFVNRFKNDSVTLSTEEFFKTSQKGSRDYDFFEKLKISLQEYLLDYGVKSNL